MKKVQRQDREEAPSVRWTVAVVRIKSLTYVSVSWWVEACIPLTSCSHTKKKKTRAHIQNSLSRLSNITKKERGKKRTLGEPSLRRPFPHSPARGPVFP